MMSANRFEHRGQNPYEIIPTSPGIREEELADVRNSGRFRSGGVNQNVEVVRRAGRVSGENSLELGDSVRS
jgi:hypothetical protein